MTEKDKYEDCRNLSEEEMKELYNCGNCRNLSEEEMKELYNCGNWHNLSEEELNEVYDAQRTRVLPLIGVNR